MFTASVELPPIPGLKVLSWSQKSGCSCASIGWDGHVCSFTFAFTRTHSPGFKVMVVSSRSAEPYNSIQPTPNPCTGPVPKRRTWRARLRYENGCDCEDG